VRPSAVVVQNTVVSLLLSLRCAIDLFFAKSVPSSRAVSGPLSLSRCSCRAMPRHSSFRRLVYCVISRSTDCAVKLCFLSPLGVRVVDQLVAILPCPRLTAKPGTTRSLKLRTYAVIEISILLLGSVACTQCIRCGLLLQTE